MKGKQTELFKVPKRKLSSYRERKGRWINYIEEQYKWKKLIKRLSIEMLSTNKPKTESPNMEQV